MNTTLKGKKIAVLGMGVSNIAAIGYLIGQDVRKLSVFDSRANPPHVELLPVGIDYHLGPFNAEELKNYDLILISPGLSVHDPVIREAREAGVLVLGDIELFAAEAKAPVVAVTGSNGKSTVTMLLGHMADKAGIKVGLGANIGRPVFEVLSDKVELYVLELSSFELETTYSLQLKGAAILNVTEDHLDRYEGSLDLYAQAKQRIYDHAECCVYNRDDPRTFPPEGRESVSFGLNNRGYGRLIENGGGVWLTVNGEKIIECSELKIAGVHNQLNALAAMALADAAGIPRKAQVEALRSFHGLQHRCQLVGRIDEVTFYNDSKATNVASALAAVTGLKDEHPEGIILLAGGLGKGQDFTPFLPYLGHEIKAVYCFGRDASKFTELSESICHPVVNMRQALHEAASVAQSGQAVLLSPACASFDQFKGFEERGQIFVSLVNHLIEKHEEELRRLEEERLERERLEQERLEQERLEQERLERERQEQERLEQERQEQERLAQAQLKLQKEQGEAPHRGKTAKGAARTKAAKGRARPAASPKSGGRNARQ